MKYFTAKWHSGGLSDAEVDAALANYRRHLRTLLPLLPSTVRNLVANVSLHDGIVEYSVLDHVRRELTLELRIGDLQRGYRSVQLLYRGVTVSAASAAALSRTSITGAELISDEVDSVSSQFVHRLFFSPENQVSIRFRTFEWAQREQENRSIFVPRSKRFRELGAARPNKALQRTGCAGR